MVSAVTKSGGGAVFDKPSDYIGKKTLGDKAACEAYANQHIYSANVPG